MSAIGLALAAFTLAAAERPYSENRVQSLAFRYRGDWTITGIAGEADAYSLGKRARRHLIGAELSITDAYAVFRRVPFRTPVLGEASYDTGSREFWLDFRTDPRALNLPSQVGTAHLEMGTLLDAGNGRYLFEYYGVWFTLARAGGAGQAPASAR